MTFVLVSTVYAVAVTKPGHGNIGPLAVGFSLFASAFIGKAQCSWLAEMSATPLIGNLPLLVGRATLQSQAWRVARYLLS